MEIKQIANLVNSVTQEISGEIAILEEDLSNVVAVGDSLANVEGLDAYVRKLPNMIGRIVFVNRKYAGGAPRGILRDGWEYGSIKMKVRGKMPDAENNEAWDLQNNTVYSMEVFRRPDVECKFVNQRETFSIPLSITEKAVRQSFHSAAELNAFIDLIYNEVDKSMTVKMDALIMRAIGNMIAETVYDGVGNTYGNTSVRAVNLLKLYNDQYGTSLAAADAIYDKDFIRFAIFNMAKYRDYMKFMSTRFNIEQTAKFTPDEYNVTILLSDFAKAAGVYLYDANGQFRVDNLTLGNVDTVPFWQGSGTSFAFSDLSSIDYDCASDPTHHVNLSGILGVMFDHDAVVVSNEERYVTTAPYNANGEFWNTWHKWNCEFSNWLDENFVVFYVHD